MTAVLLKDGNPTIKTKQTVVLNVTQVQLSAFHLSRSYPLGEKHVSQELQHNGVNDLGHFLWPRLLSAAVLNSISLWLQGASIFWGAAPAGLGIACRPSSRAIRASVPFALTATRPKAPSSWMAATRLSGLASLRQASMSAGTAPDSSRPSAPATRITCERT